MKTLFVIQSNYIPWKGYFDAINRADVVVIYDEMQYTKNDWRNRNVIKTPNGLQWLTIPVKMSGRFGQKINETEVVNDLWRKKHWKTLLQNYRKAPCFDAMKDRFEPLYLGDQLTKNLSEINLHFITTIIEILEIKTQVYRSKDFNMEGDKNQRLLSLCSDLKIDHYLSGPAASSYLDTNAFQKQGIKVSFLDYSGYPEYNQLFGDFEHGVSIIDLIFNHGKQARTYMKSFNNEK